MNKGFEQRYHEMCVISQQQDTLIKELKERIRKQQTALNNIKEAIENLYPDELQVWISKEKQDDT